MAILNRKSRMISLRLSDDEYEALRTIYRSHGSRSLSEFARDAMKKVIKEDAAASSTLESRLLNLDTRMQELDHVVGRLVNMIEARVIPATSTHAAA